ncbi:MAG: hypothetical protein IIC36_13980 [Gemmatimonadetes bacterium]|nr:hypothetical protein [Gemmatimonadota bacterium]MCH7935096.1 hypothetical protein [Gemmatimonadota bacterium]
MNGDVEMMSGRRNRLLVTVTVLILSAGIAACSGEPQASPGDASEPLLAETPNEHAAAESIGSERSGDDARSEAEGEHSEGREARESGEHRERAGGGEHEEDGEGEGEESGVYIGRGDAWDVTRRGARLVLAFDPASHVFIGRIENTTESMLCAVRVEVHLANGKELGPTERTNMRAGESMEIELPAGEEAFESWTAHPEVSRCSNE